MAFKIFYLVIKIVFYRDAFIFLGADVDISPHRMSYTPSFSKRKRDEAEEEIHRSMISPLELSCYTTGWIRTISLYAESKSSLNNTKSKQILTANLVIGNPHKQT